MVSVGLEKFKLKMLSDVLATRYLSQLNERNFLAGCLVVLSDVVVVVVVADGLSVCQTLSGPMPRAKRAARRSCRPTWAATSGN